MVWRDQEAMPLLGGAGPIHLLVGAAESVVLSQHCSRFWSVNENKETFLQLHETATLLIVRK